MKTNKELPKFKKTKNSHPSSKTKQVKTPNIKNSKNNIETLKTSSQAINTPIEEKTLEKKLPRFDTFGKIKKEYQVKNPFEKKIIKKLKVSKYQHLKNLKSFLEKGGYSIDNEAIISRSIIRIAIFLNLILTFYLLYTAYYRSEKIVSLLPTLFAVWSILLLIIIMILWVVFYIIVDLKIFNRRLAVEEVLPDFLMLTSSNINAGMPIDQALWYAVRPRFGILAKEIEEVAKQTLVGDELKDALLNFTKKYDSLILKRSINLLLEGVDSGGKVADIISKIATDIQTTRIFKKEMAANVTTYVIFISVASIAAAPFLFALSKQLLIIISSIMGNMDVGGGGGIGFSFDASAISISDYNIFSIVTLMMTATFSAMIISIIKKGNIKEGLSYIPPFTITVLIIYLVASKILDVFLGGMF